MEASNEGTEVISMSSDFTRRSSSIKLEASPGSTITELHKNRIPSTVSPSALPNYLSPSGRSRDEEVQPKPMVQGE